MDHRLSCTGKFTQEITGLWPGGTYHIRAYATNNMRTARGITCDFTTLATHEVTTDLITILSQTVVKVVGSVTKISSLDVAERGICYGTTPSPAIEGLRVVVPINAVGTLSCNLQNLTLGTHYYVRAYVRIHSEDWWLWEILIPFYGNEIIFVAGDPGSVFYPDLFTSRIKDILFYGLEDTHSIIIEPTEIGSGGWSFQCKRKNHFRFRTC